MTTPPAPALPGDTHIRSFRPDLEVRSGGDGRTIYGIAVPYNAPTKISENLIEQFCRGAFNHQLNAPQRVKFSREHILLGGTLIGAASVLRDDPAGLYVELRASKTPVGDETLELVRDGALNQLSIMFRELQNRRLAGNITERVKAHLGEVAAVLEGAFGDLASAIGVRSRSAAEATDDFELRRKAEEFLKLPTPRDTDLEVRAIRLGLPFAS
jgi:Escherichia/Staphylococcus phage prohead protease